MNQMNLISLSSASNSGPKRNRYDICKNMKSSYVSFVTTGSMTDREYVDILSQDTRMAEEKQRKLRTDFRG